MELVELPAVGERPGTALTGPRIRQGMFTPRVGSLLTGRHLGQQKTSLRFPPPRLIGGRSAQTGTWTSSTQAAFVAAFRRSSPPVRRPPRPPLGDQQGPKCHPRARIRTPVDHEIGGPVGGGAAGPDATLFRPAIPPTSPSLSQRKSLRNCSLCPDCRNQQ